MNGAPGKDAIPSGVIFTASGTRGIVGETLGPRFILDLGLAYGSWLRDFVGGSDPSVLIGRDTRPSGQSIEAGIVHGLLSTGCRVFLAGVSPTPAIVHGKKHLGMDGAVMISASHNPAEYNGLKFLSPEPPGTFLSNDELEKIRAYLENIDDCHYRTWKIPDRIENVNILEPYLAGIRKFINDLAGTSLDARIVLDTGAGTGNVATLPLLESLGCRVETINKDMLDSPPFFPRNSEPIRENLGELSARVVEGGADLGIALDCDGDRISLCDEKGNILREDIGLAILMKNLLQFSQQGRKLVIVTNCASSLMFEDIARQHGGEVVRTPVGERYLAVKMDKLFRADTGRELLVLGGEGSCGGIMMPELNLARDGTLAAGCIVAILKNRGATLSAIATELPEYHLVKKKVVLDGRDALEIMEKLEEFHEGDEFEKVLHDIRFSGDGWWVLIHPSNTEPIIRVMAEARTREKAAALLEKYEKEVLETMT